MFDEIKNTLSAINNKIDVHIGEFRYFRQQVEGDLQIIRDDMTNMNDSLQSISNHTSQLNSRLEAVNESLTHYQLQTVAKLAYLHVYLDYKLDPLINTTAQSSDQQEIQTNYNLSDVGCMNIKQSILLHQTLQNNLTHQLEKIQDEVTDLKLICEPYYTLICEPYYTLICEPYYTCGGTGGWRRAVYLDMTEPNTTCPSGWQETTNCRKTCGKVSGGYLSCDSVTFPVNGGPYNRVCGRIIGYQYGHIDAFEPYHIGRVTTIDGAYVSGVSLTHGSPRQHIWTFAGGAAENQPTWVDACPCDATINITVPSFVGGDYFCESAGNSGRIQEYCPDDPLWDGKGCTNSSNCCSLHGPPYFVQDLPSTTTDDLEARLCWLGSSEETPIELIELYVQ